MISIVNMDGTLYYSSYDKSEVTRTVGLPYQVTTTRENCRSSFLVPAFYPYSTLLGSLFLNSMDATALNYYKSQRKFEQLVEDKSLVQVVKDTYKFHTEPMDHQYEALGHVLHRPRLGLNYGPGTGKGKIMLDAINILGAKALVVAPRICVENWKKEQIKHAPNLKTLSLLGTAKKRKKLLETSNQYDILAVTYDVCRTDFMDIQQKFNYDTIILDESTKIKNSKASRTKAINSLTAVCGRRYLLSGTLTVGDPRDFFPQLNIISEGSVGPNAWLFSQRYCVFSDVNIHMCIGYQNLGQLNKITRHLIIKRTKEECLDLPKRQILHRSFEPTKAQLQWYNSITQGDIVFENGDKMDTSMALIKLNKLAMVSSGFVQGKKVQDVCPSCVHCLTCISEGTLPYTDDCFRDDLETTKFLEKLNSNPKLDSTSELLDEILEDKDNKSIIWCVYKQEILDLRELLIKKKVGFVEITGSTVGSRQPLIDKFNEDDSVKVFLCMESIGIGFTINAANYMIYYSTNFDLDNYEQSIDRNYRIGQEKCVTVYHMIMEDSMDIQVLGALESKENIQKDLLSFTKKVDDVFRKKYTVKMKAIKEK